MDSLPYTLKANTFYFTIPQQVHLKEEMRPMQGLAVRFTGEFLQLEENRSLQELPLLQNPAAGHELKLSAGDMAFVEEAMRRMLKEFKGSESWKNQMLTAQLRVLVIAWVRRCGLFQPVVQAAYGGDPAGVSNGDPGNIPLIPGNVQGLPGVPPVALRHE